MSVLSRPCAFLGVGVGDLLVYVPERQLVPDREEREPADMGDV
ncbi:MAG: helix-turn-helix transcriptional regulator [Chloroflexota bacterium]|nr:helix-turn-helix transcriptional regulator [Chloroflexota bacterium]